MRLTILSPLTIAVWLGLAPLAQAADEDAAGLWAFALGAERDDHSSEALLATLNLGVGARTWLSFVAGRTQAERAGVEADTLGARIDHRFGLVGVTFEIERWGDAGALESEDWGGSFYFDRPRWRLAFELEQRALEVPFTLTGPLGGSIARTTELDAESFGVALRVRPAERWLVFGSLAEHDYERDLALLPRIERLNFLSASTLTLANSLVDRERSIGFEREVGRGAVHAVLSRDESAVDGAKFETFGAGWLFPIARRVDLEVSFGRGRSELLEPAYYGGVLFVIYGR